ncbi:MAG: 2-methylthioadenine synthetase, partial [Thermoplasmata archaeon]
MKVYIETYGCWLNKGESQVMASLLEKRGARLVESIDEADVVIVNTCAVRGDTETKMLRRIRELEDYRRKLGFRLVVAGCLVNIRPKTILEISPEASLVEPDAVEKIGDVVFSDKQVFFVRQYRGSRTILPRYSGGPTYVVPIQTGCLGNCAFCVEWVGRGRGVKSYSPRLIVDAVLDAVRRGAKEVYLTGQDVAAYGVDIGLSLVDLVEAILESVEGEYWIRLGMMEPLLTFKQIDRLLVLVRDERMYKYFHIPVQSGDDRVLRLMNRKYTVQQYKDLVGKIRKGLGRWHSL